MVFLTLAAANRTANKTKEAPKLEAIAIPQLEIAKEVIKPPNIPDPKIKRATPKLAPEEIPKTKGPASGFLNNVCINKPLMESPEPTKIAVIAFGNLKFRIIKSQLDFELLPPERISKISEKGMETDPKLMFAKVNSSKVKVK